MELNFAANELNDYDMKEHRYWNTTPLQTEHWSPFIEPSVEGDCYIMDFNYVKNFDLSFFIT